MQLNTSPKRRRLEALDDRRRIVSNRKHSAVSLGLEFDTSRLEPAYGVARLKFVERSDQFLVSARVTLKQPLDLKAIVGHIASSAAGNSDFVQRLAARFYHRHLGIAKCLRAGDCGEIARCPGADNSNVQPALSSRPISQIISNSIGWRNPNTFFGSIAIDRSICCENRELKERIAACRYAMVAASV